MNESQPPAFTEPPMPPMPPVPTTPPPDNSKKVRNIVIGCLAAALIGIGLVCLLLTMMCSQLGNMH